MVGQSFLIILDLGVRGVTDSLGIHEEFGEPDGSLGQVAGTEASRLDILLMSLCSK